MPELHLSDEEKRIREIIATVVSKYSTRNLISMVVTAFGFGGWATTMQLKMNYTMESIAKSEVISGERLKEWTSWRNSASAKIDQTRWIVESHETRISNLERDKK